MRTDRPDLRALLAEILGRTSVSDPETVAAGLTAAFGSFSTVLDTPCESLLRVKGMTRDAVVLLGLMQELIRRSLVQQKPLPRRAVGDALGEFGTARFYAGTRERMLIVLAKKGRIFTFFETEPCTAAQAEEAASRIIDRALVEEADSLTLMHNHPGGFAIPSAADNAAFAALSRQCSRVGIAVSDQIVIADGDFVSLRDSTYFEDKK